MMRIDFVVDAYSRSYPGKNERAQPAPASHADVTNAKQMPEQRPVEDTPPQEATANSVDEGVGAGEEVLSVQEKQMLQQLFPPGLFGSGIRAYRNCSAPVREVQTLGKTIDVRK